MLVGIRQQREETRALDRQCQLTLITRAGAGDAGRNDLAVLANVTLEQGEILVVDLRSVVRAELAGLLATIALLCHCLYPFFRFRFFSTGRRVVRAFRLIRKSV